MLDQSNQPAEPQQTPAPSAPAAPRSKRNTVALAVGGGCALLACVVLALAILFSALFPSLRSRLVPSNTGSQPTIPASLTQGDNTLGDPNAPVKMVEYADFQCPYCRNFAVDTQPQIIETYVKTGKVYFEYRSVGAFIGPESGAAAQAAYCAGDQGKFWQYHDALFSHWTGENVGDFTQDKLLQYADPVGLDKAAFSDCLTSGKYAQRVDEDASNAKTDGVRATPSFLINGKLVEGAQPFGVFQEAIDAALQGK